MTYRAFSISPISAWLLAAMPLPTQTPPPAVTEIVTDLRSQCAAFDGGALDMREGAVQAIDLSGNGEPDWAVDTFDMTCSTAHSLTCGTGGCSLFLVVDGAVTKRLSKGWDTVDLGPIHTVLLQIHGADCGGTNLNYCVEAMVWDETDGKFYSLAPRPE